MKNTARAVSISLILSFFTPALLSANPDVGPVNFTVGFTPWFDLSEYPDPGPKPNPDYFARRSLEIYTYHLLIGEVVKGFNFQDLAEARSASLGSPLRVKFIGLRSLRNFTPGQSATSIMMDTKKLWYPVMVGAEVRTKLEIRLKEGRLKMGDFGGVRTVMKITEARNHLLEVFRLNNTAEYRNLVLVKVPALRAAFLYFEAARGVEQRGYLIPATIRPQRLGLEEKRIYRAETVLAVLANVARTMDGTKID